MKAAKIGILSLALYSINVSSVLAYCDGRDDVFRIKVTETGAIIAGEEGGSQDVEDMVGRLASTDVRCVIVVPDKNAPWRSIYPIIQVLDDRGVLFIRPEKDGSAASIFWEPDAVD